MKSSNPNISDCRDISPNDRSKGNSCLNINCTPNNNSQPERNSPYSPDDFSRHVSSPKSNAFNPSSDPTQKSVSAAVKNLFPSSSTSRRAKCKVGKKYKHSCGFLMNCDPSEATLHVLCSISCSIEKILKNQKIAKAEKSSTVSSAGKDQAIDYGEDVELPESVSNLVPLENMEQLAKLESELELNKDLSELVVKYYAQECRGDKGPSKSARNILRALMDKKMLSKFTLKGGYSNSNERKFQLDNRTVYKVMMSSVKMVWKDRCPEYKKAVDESVTTFLTQTKKKNRVVFEG